MGGGENVVYNDVLRSVGDSSLITINKKSVIIFSIQINPLIFMIK